LCGVLGAYPGLGCPNRRADKGGIHIGDPQRQARESQNSLLTTGASPVGFEITGLSQSCDSGFSLAAITGLVPRKTACTRFGKEVVYRMSSLNQRWVV
jgi:hypothetical protein